MRGEWRARIALLACAFAAACSPAGPVPNTPGRRAAKALTTNPYAPRLSDAKWVRGSIEIDQASLRASASAGTSALILAGSLPTPCHELRLRIPEGPDAQGVLRIEAWSVAAPGRICAQMLQPFSVQVQIFIGNASALRVNGLEVGW